MDKLTKTPKLNVVFTGVNEVYRLEIQSVMLIFSPVTFSLVHLPPHAPPPFPVLKYSINCTDSVWLGGGGVLSCVGDHILQEFYTMYLTRLGTYKIALPPQTNPRRGGGLGQINTCRQVPVQVNYFR